MKKSNDEILAINAEHERVKVAPAREAAELMERLIDKTLQSLGVNLNGDIKAQQEERRIKVVDSEDFLRAWIGNPDLAPQLNGFFVMQVIGDQPVPVAFIGDAGVDSEGHITVTVEDYRTNEKIIVSGNKLPERKEKL